MFPVTITLQTPAQLAAVLGALGGLPTVPAAQAQPAEAKPEAPGKSAKPEAASPARGRPTAEAAADGAAEKNTDKQEPQTDMVPAAAANSASEPPIPYERVGRAITEAVKTNRQKVIDTLKEFGVAKGPELKPEQYAAFLAALEG